MIKYQMIPFSLVSSPQRTGGGSGTVKWQQKFYTPKTVMKMLYPLSKFYNCASTEELGTHPGSLGWINCSYEHDSWQKQAVTLARIRHKKYRVWSRGKKSYASGRKINGKTDSASWWRRKEIPLRCLGIRKQILWKCSLAWLLPSLPVLQMINNIFEVKLQ